jgi:hypothetical protein
METKLHEKLRPSAIQSQCPKVLSTQTASRQSRLSWGGGGERIWNDLWRVTFSMATKSKETLRVLTKKGLESNFLHIFFLRTAGLLVPAVVFRTDTVRNGTEMFKKIIADLRLAVMLIATENLSALRVVLKSMMNLVHKSARLGKKS